MTVTDGFNTATYTVNVIVRPNDHLPVVDAGEDIGATQGDTVRLDGTVSDQDRSDTVISEWTQISGTLIAIDDPTNPVLEFTAPTVTVVTTLVFQLVGIGDSNTVTDSVNVVVKTHNQELELLVAPEDQTVYSGNKVTLESAGFDNDDDITYQRTQTSGAEITLNNADKRTVTFTAPEVEGCIVLRLTLSAGG